VTSSAIPSKRAKGVEGVGAAVETEGEFIEIRLQDVGGLNLKTGKLQRCDEIVRTGSLYNIQGGVMQGAIVEERGASSFPIWFFNAMKK